MCWENLKDNVKHDIDNMKYTVSEIIFNYISMLEMFTPPKT